MSQDVCNLRPPAASQPALMAHGKRSGWNALLVALRPKQWIKNGVLLAGLVFTLNQWHPLSNFLRAGAAVAVFCLLASAIYLVNDVCDLDQDRKHPRKS